MDMLVVSALWNLDRPSCGKICDVCNACSKILYDSNSRVLTVTQDMIGSL